MTRGGRLASGLDFAHPQRGMRRGTTPAGWALLVLGVLLAGWLLQDYAALETQRDVLRGQLRESTLQQAQSGGSAGLSAAQAAEVRFADETLKLAALPWDAIFQDIEAAAAPGIVLSHLQPQGRSREIRLAGEARDFAALSAYLARLEDRPGLAAVQLLGHQLTEPGGTLKFEAQARWSEP